LLILAIVLRVVSAARAEEVGVEFREEPGRVLIRLGGEDIASYFYRDPQTTRPYFAHVRAPGGGPQVTRNHPPVVGTDPTDHAALHPGLWLAFGDLGGADSWRNKARVEHERFAEAPRGGAGRGTFSVVNRYLSAKGDRTICRETCRYTVLARPDGYLLITDSEFRSEDGDFAFGDQEEMGLGVRLATPLAVKQGGRMVNSGGESGEKAVRGKTAAWCDGRGRLGGREAGIAVMADPGNFRPSWFHARDYGLIVANPFGRKALTKGEPSRVVVPRGEPFHLGFAAFVHSTPEGQPADVGEAYQDYLTAIGRSAR
jgi:hypothetical protein